MKAALVLVLLAATALAVPHTARTDLRIVDGHSVSDPNPFPWVAMLLFQCANANGAYRCTGSVVQDNAVVTAAHCYVDCGSDVFLAEVRIGRETNNVVEKSSVAAVYRHPAYDNSSILNDVAVWILEDKLTKVEKYPYLPSGGVNTGLSVIAAGFGKLGGSDGAPLATTLQQVGLEVQPDGLCKSYFEDYNSNTEICAGADGGGRDSCNGDSGGPLFTTEDCCYYPHATLRGITSYGATDCGALDGAVYTDVSQYTDFIETILTLHAGGYDAPGDQCCECDGSNGDVGKVVDTGCTLSWASHLSAPLAFAALVAALVATQ